MTEATSHNPRVFDDATVLARRSAPLAAAMDDETVMFDPAKGSYYALGAVGTRVWNLLELPIPTGRLYSTLLEEFEVDAATCRREVGAFLDQLYEADLIEVEP